MSSILRVIAITDRRLMVPADVLAAGDWTAIAHAFGEAVQRAVRSCAPNRVAIQVREKDLDGGPLLQLVQTAQAFCSRVIVNDRIDIALITRAYGVQLPERGIRPEDARALAPQLVVSVSRHAPPIDSAGADLVQLGPIWPTTSKPGARVLGEAALAWPHGTAALVAVGGIDSPERAERAAAAGADAVALIRSAWTGASVEPFVRAVDHGLARRYLLSDAGMR